MDKLPQKKKENKKRSICLPFEEETYKKLVEEPVEFRNYVDKMISAFPELFPQEVQNGYTMKDSRWSKKLELKIRRIEVNSKAYTIRPSFVMPNMSGHVKDVEKALFLRKFAVPFWALASVFGKDAMYWYRMERSLGENSLVGTTVTKPEKLPKDICADEKHTKIKGEKVYIATTAGKGCILGAALAQSADEEGLTKAYGEFKKEAQLLKPGYSPETINIDGWEATKKAWKSLFSSITIILCFLHIYIAIRDRTKKKHNAIFQYVSDRLWKCFHANRRQCFSQGIRRLYLWAKNNQLQIPDVVFQKLSKLYHNRASYSVAYAFPTAQRTSNMLDRLLQRMDRFLFSTQYFHRSFQSASHSIRGWALIQNFAPFNPRTARLSKFYSPAERINGFRYHDSWLQNLLISASLGGYRTPPQNPL